MSTAQDVILRVRDLINDEVGTFVTDVRWSDAELMQWISEGEREIVRIKPEANPVTEVFDVVAATPRQRLSPTDAYRLIRVEANARGAAAEPEPPSCEIYSITEQMPFAIDDLVEEGFGNTIILDIPVPDDGNTARYLSLSILFDSTNPTSAQFDSIEVNTGRSCDVELHAVFTRGQLLLLGILYDGQGFTDDTVVVTLHLPSNRNYGIRARPHWFGNVSGVFYTKTFDGSTAGSASMAGSDGSAFQSTLVISNAGQTDAAATDVTISAPTGMTSDTTRMDLLFLVGERGYLSRTAYRIGNPGFEFTDVTWSFPNDDGSAIFVMNAVGLYSLCDSAPT